MTVEAVQPIVRRKIGVTYKARVGRGFSKAELKEVRLSICEARRLGLRVDERRNTKHEENVKKLEETLGDLRK